MRNNCYAKRADDMHDHLAMQQSLVPIIGKDTVLILYQDQNRDCSGMMRNAGGHE